MVASVTDPQTGISMRFIDAWDPPHDTDVSMVEVVMVYSCRSLGHTFVYNVGEACCQVCGAKNPHAST